MSVVIPALDEEQSIGAVIDAIPRDVVGEVIVVDGGSRDATVAVAGAHGARVLSETRRGYGRACARGVLGARGEVVVFLDADGAGDPKDIPALVAPIVNGTADLVLGSRLGPGRAARMTSSAMPVHQRLGNLLAAHVIRIRHGVPVTDLSPFRAARRVMLLTLPITDVTFGWPTEMIVEAAHAGWRIVEKPVSWRPRTGGASKISGTLRGTILAGLHILNVVARSALPAQRRAASGSPFPGSGVKSAVVLMAKPPVPGRTKTRLCPPLTPGEAAELSQAFLTDTITLVCGLRDTSVAVAVTPPSAVEQLRRLVPGHVRVLGVEGADIGECLCRATGQLLAEGFMRIVALGSDGPTVPGEYIARALEALAACDVVLGPAEDGGYYLIGVRQGQPGLFAGIEWSTPEVTAQTLERAAALNLTVIQMPSWHDVDTPSDLERLRGELATRSQGIASCTRAFLAGH